MTDEEIDALVQEADEREESLGHNTGLYGIVCTLAEELKKMNDAARRSFIQAKPYTKDLNADQ